MKTKKRFYHAAKEHSFSVQVIIAVLFITLIGITTGCGKDTLPKPPESFIKDFLMKRERMVDSTIAELYVQDEQETIRTLVDAKAAHSKKQGEYVSLMNSTIDLSKLKIKTIAEKEVYIDDTPVAFLKVSVKGPLVIQEKLKDPVKRSLGEEVILKEEGGNWKITQIINPWK